MKPNLTPGELSAIRTLYYWQYRNTSSFKDMLYTLLAKADHWNFHKLSQVFPNEAFAFNLWKDSPNQIHFFNSFNLPPKDDDGTAP